MSGFRIERATAGVDWLTATCQDKQLAFRLESLADEAATRLATRGMLTDHWQWRGYRGWKIGGLKWGKREDGVICIISGEAARAGWCEVMHFATNITRIDLALTFYLEKPYPQLANIIYEYLLAVKESREALTRMHFSWIVNHQRAETLYVGSRSSDQFGRVYDKGLESACASEPGYIWRYEIELKQERAKKVADGLYSHYMKDCDVTKRIASTVNHWFESRYVPVAGDHYATPYEMEVSARVTDADAKLNWLSRQVSPTVSKLFAAGVARERVEEALGLLKGRASP